MTNEMRMTPHKLGLLLGTLALSTLTVGCGEMEEHLDDEDTAEVTQGLTTIVLRGGDPGVTAFDSGLLQATPSTNTGNADKFQVGIGGPSARAIGLLSWDVSSIPLGSTISSATLKITTGQAYGVAPEVHRVTRAWTEATANWNSMGTGYDPAIIAQYPPLSVIGTTLASTRDITPLVQGWVSGTQANFGLALVAESNPGAQGIFYSRECTVASYRPVLTITYEPPFCFGQPDGTMCNDGNGCTQTDTCQGGQCEGSNPVVCPTNTECAADSCNPATGTCSTLIAPDGTPCNDGNLCTQTSRCLGGMCVGENPVQCTSPDPCTAAGVCQAATGTCTTGGTTTADFQSGLTHRWTFNEPSGPALDMVGGANGLLTSYMQRTPSFDGTTAFTAIPGSPQEGATLYLPAPLAHPNYTFSAWVWHPSTPVDIDTDFIQLGDGSAKATGTLTHLGLMRWRTQANPGYEIELNSASPLNDGQWHHHAIRRNGGAVTAFIDGRSTGHHPYLDAIVPSGGIRLHGWPERTVKFEDVRYYNRALTSCSIFKLSKAPTNPAAPPPGCAPNPVSLWRGEDSLVDAVGTNHGTSGTLNGATPVTYGNGKYSRAFSLNGTSYIEVPTAANLEINGAISMSAWVYLHTTTGRIINKSVNTGDGYIFDAYLGRLRLIAGSNVIIANSLLPTGRWIHVAGTWDGTNGKLYVDGAVVPSTNPATPQPFPINTSALRIGATGAGGNRLNGLLDEVAIYNLALSAEQVANMAQSLPMTLPIGWWKAESNMNDASGNENNGTSGTGAGTTPVTYTPGKTGNAFVLPGSSFVQVPDSPNLQITGAMTMSAWIRSSSPDGRIFDKISAGNTNGYLFDLSQGKLRMILGSQVFTTVANVPLNTWAHVAGTWNGTTARLYVNGLLAHVTTPPNPLPIPSNTLPLRIGADSNGASRFNGFVDEAALHNIALTQAQIQTMANQTAPPAFVSACPGVVGGQLASFDASSLRGVGITATENAPVPQWTNLVNPMKHAVQSAAARQPKFKMSAIRGKPAVQFDGVDDVLSLPLNINPANYPNLTVVAVLQNAPGNPQTYAGVWGHDNGGFDRFLITGGVGAFQKGISNGSAVLGVPGITAESTPLVVITTLRNNGGTNSSTVHLNGAQVLTFTENHPNAGAPSMSIGNLEGPPGNGALSFDGFISVLEVYDHALNTAERTAVYARLAALYL